MPHPDDEVLRPADEINDLAMWTFIATQECVHLHDALDELVDANKHRLQAPRRFQEAFHRAYGRSFFLVSASSHVVALLDRDPFLGRLPGGVHEKIRTLRNVLEHWDQWPIERLSAKSFREDFPGVWPYELRFTDGDLLLGGVLSFRALEADLTALYRWLKSLSPGRLHPPIAETIHEYPLEDD